MNPDQFHDVFVCAINRFGRLDLRANNNLFGSGSTETPSAKDGVLLPLS